MDTIQQAIDLIDTERVVALASRFCSIPSPRGEEAELAWVIAETLDRDGIEVLVEDVVDGRPNVQATVRGRGQRPPLVLNGHLDAGVYPEGWTGDPFTPWVEGGLLYGGGVADMKGGLAAMTAAMEQLNAVQELPGDVVFQAVMHHDTIGLGTKYLLAADGPTSGYGICGEPSDLSIHTANGGAIKYEVEFRGRGAHISSMEEGSDALLGAVRAHEALTALRFEHAPDPRLPDLPRMVIGELSGGEGPGLVPRRAVIRGDVRTVPGMGRSAVRGKIEAAVKGACPDGVTALVRILAKQRPFLGAESGPLVDALASAHESVRGAPPAITSELPGQAFVTDAADMAEVGLETVVYGPGVWRFAGNEHVSASDLADAARIYLAVAATLR